MQRVGDPAVSPDGKRVAFAVRDTDYDANRGRFDIWLAAIDGTGASTRLTTSPDNDTDPAWSPDGKWIYFLSTRGGSLAGLADRADRRRGRAGDEAAGRRQRLQAVPRRQAARARARRVARREDARRDRQARRRQGEVEGQGAASTTSCCSATGTRGRTASTRTCSCGRPSKPSDARDLTPGSDDRHRRPSPFGGMDEVSISPDGTTVAYVARVGGREQAWTTNTDVFLVPSDGSGARDRSHRREQGLRLRRRRSRPTARRSRCSTMARPGFESDRQRLAVIDIGDAEARASSPRRGTARPASSTWSADGKHDLHDRRQRRQPLDLRDRRRERHGAKLLVDKGTNSDAARRRRSHRVRARHARAAGRAVHVRSPTAATSARSRTSTTRASRTIAWGELRAVHVQGREGRHRLRLRDQARRATSPAARCRSRSSSTAARRAASAITSTTAGTPRSSPATATRVVMIDFHGSTGYGQAFTDAISGDWGGAPYEDLMKGLDAALAKYTLPRRRRASPRSARRTAAT